MTTEPCFMEPNKVKLNFRLDTYEKGILFRGRKTDRAEGQLIFFFWSVTLFYIRCFV